jgi:hypothetical protein
MAVLAFDQGKVFQLVPWKRTQYWMRFNLKRKVLFRN